MTKVLLTAAAQRAVNQVTRLYGADVFALIITPDARSDTLLGRLINRSVLTALKARLIEKTVTGMEIYTFGINVFPADTTVEVIPLRLKLSNLGNTQTALPELADCWFRINLSCVSPTQDFAAV